MGIEKKVRFFRSRSRLQLLLLLPLLPFFSPLLPFPPFRPTGALVPGSPALIDGLQKRGGVERNRRKEELSKTKKKLKKKRTFLADGREVVFVDALHEVAHVDDPRGDLLGAAGLVLAKGAPGEGGCLF